MLVRLAVREGEGHGDAHVDADFRPLVGLGLDLNALDIDEWLLPADTAMNRESVRSLANVCRCGVVQLLAPLLLASLSGMMWSIPEADTAVFPSYSEYQLPETARH
ncbi:hypothetical protein [Streptomyces atratus]|uniref:hypothetical protein n=1 Tax=Streptomyces atratus TaxID=1893 RepID=UPI00365DAF4D